MEQVFVERITSMGFPYLHYGLRTRQGRLVESGFETTGAAYLWARQNGYAVIE